MRLDQQYIHYMQQHASQWHFLFLHTFLFTWNLFGLSSKRFHSVGKVRLLTKLLPTFALFLLVWIWSTHFWWDVLIEFCFCFVGTSFRNITPNINFIYNKKIVTIKVLLYKVSDKLKNKKEFNIITLCTIRFLDDHSRRVGL